MIDGLSYTMRCQHGEYHFCAYPPTGMPDLIANQVNNIFNDQYGYTVDQLAPQVRYLLVTTIEHGGTVIGVSLLMWLMPRTIQSMDAAERCLVFELNSTYIQPDLRGRGLGSAFTLFRLQNALPGLLKAILHSDSPLLIDPSVDVESLPGEDGLTITNPQIRAGILNGKVTIRTNIENMRWLSHFMKIASSATNPDMAICQTDSADKLKAATGFTVIFAISDQVVTGELVETISTSTISIVDEIRWLSGKEWAIIGADATATANQLRLEILSRYSVVDDDLLCIAEDTGVLAYMLDFPGQPEMAGRFPSIDVLEGITIVNLEEFPYSELAGRLLQEIKAATAANKTAIVQLPNTLQAYPCWGVILSS